MSRYGINGKLITWIKSFLSNRRQRVRLKNYYSSFEPVLSGVPQGSVIGPLLFIIYINDLPDNSDSNLLMFADDTKLFRPLSTTSSYLELQNDINSLVDWSNKWELKFNSSKCYAMHIGTNAPNSYDMFDIIKNKRVQLDSIKEEKDLGVILDDKLKFSSNIATQVNKANKTMGLIRRSYSYLDKTSFRYLFNSLVRPYLEYCVSIWYPLLKKDEDLIENVLRRGSKLIPGLSHLPYSQRLSEMKIPCMKYRRMRGDMILLYRILSDENSSLLNLFQFNDNSTTRGHNKKLKKSFVRSKLRQHFFSNRCVNNWNSLPYDVVNAISLNSFKIALDEFWISKWYDI